MLCAIRDLAPELAALFSLSTVNPPLCSGGITAFILQQVRSKEIMWVPFCFALLSIYNLTSQLQSELCLFNLDNGTLGEATKQVLSDAEELGLSLNHSKSEVISEDPTARNVLLSAVPNLQVTDPASATLGFTNWQSQLHQFALWEKTDSQKILVGRIHYLNTRDTLLSNSKAAVHPLNSSLFPF